jgi:hypothetical protein
VKNFFENHADKIKRLIQVLLVIMLIGLLSTCFYDSDAEKLRKSRKWNPTAENITYWEQRKGEWFEGRVCEIMYDEAVRYNKNGQFCSDDFSSIVRSGKLVAEVNDAWFGMIGIPKEYRSLDNISITLESLSCKETVREWSNCPTGLSYRR